jgi:hypothetical protein
MVSLNNHFQVTLRLKLGKYAEQLCYLGCVAVAVVNLMTVCFLSEEANVMVVRMLNWQFLAANGYVTWNDFQRDDL